jgi:peroxiredoxin
MALQVGQLAPDFSLENQMGEKIRLGDYLGKKNVVIAFFPLAWTPV